MTTSSSSSSGENNHRHRPPTSSTSHRGEDADAGGTSFHTINNHSTTQPPLLPPAAATAVITATTGTALPNSSSRDRRRRTNNRRNQGGDADAAIKAEIRAARSTTSSATPSAPGEVEPTAAITASDLVATSTPVTSSFPQLPPAPPASTSVSHMPPPEMIPTERVAAVAALRGSSQYPSGEKAAAATAAPGQPSVGAFHTPGRAPGHLPAWMVNRQHQPQQQIEGNGNSNSNSAALPPEMRTNNNENSNHHLPPEMRVSRIQSPPFSEAAWFKFYVSWYKILQNEASFFSKFSSVLHPAFSSAAIKLEIFR